MGLFGSIGKAITGGLTGGVESAIAGSIGQAAGLGTSAALGGSGEPYTEHLRKGIQWRVQDAKKAGVHPLFALGASVAGPTPNMTDPSRAAMAETVSSGIQHGFGAPARAEAKKMAVQSHGASLTESYTRAAANAASARRDDAAALELNSRVARALGRANVKQDAIVPPGREPPVKGARPSQESVTLPFGIPWTTGESPLAQWAEEHYSDLGGLVYGAGRLIEDLESNIAPHRKKFYQHLGGKKRLPRQDRTRDPMWGLY